MRNLIVFLPLLLTLGCATTEKQVEAVTEAKPELPKSKVQQRNMMLGKWYGDLPTKEGGRRQWTVTRSEDGTYQIDFLITKPDNTEQRFSEAGHWGVAGNIYFSMYRGAIEQGQFYPSDPNDPYNYDAYNMINLTNSAFEYQNIDSKNKYIIKKVPLNFILGESKL
jgi:hypothetical protein